MWMNKDESWNFLQDYDPELIRQEKRKELETEIRVQVPYSVLWGEQVPDFSAASLSFSPTDDLPQNFNDLPGCPRKSQA